jgi:hypothetical protein
MVPSVVEVEGLHSPKAIAFISNSLKPFNYFTVCKRKPSENNNLSAAKLLLCSMDAKRLVNENLGEKIWIK